MNLTVTQLKMLSALASDQWMVNGQFAARLGLSAMELSGRQPKEGYWSDDELSDYYTLRKKPYMDDNGIAHIEVRGGMLMDCAPLYERVGLAIRYSTIIAETEAAKEAGAKGIAYRINSPGGTVSGNAEAADAVMSVGLPTLAYCEGLACSAAYKFAAGTTAIVASKSAVVGNIGTIYSWTDWSKFMEKWGVEAKAITNEDATLKSMFYLQPSEEQLAFLQDSANRHGKEFRDHVVAGRGRVGVELNDEVWKAGWYSGDQAGSLGLIDAVGSYNESVAHLVKMVSGE